MMNQIFVAALFISSAITLDAQPNVSNLLTEVELPYSKIRSLSYSVTRTTETRQREVEEKWSFHFRSPNDLRVDYIKPQKRTFYLHENTLWEYIPEAGKARRTDIEKLDDAEKAAVLKGFISRTAIPGLRIGDFANMLNQHVTTKETGKGMVLMQGQNPRFSLEIDSTRNVILSTALYNDKGELTLSTSSSAFKEIAQGFWFPMQIEAVQVGEGIASRSLFRFTSLQANVSIKDDFFRFQPDQNTQVIPYPEPDL